jgi:hypothetical protein
MKLNDLDREWEKEAPTLAAMGRINPFSVPSDYFESLSNNLTSRALIESARFENEQEFSIPKGYFEQLEKQINEKIIIDNINEIAPYSGFSIPNDYFVNLGQSIERKIEQQRVVKKRNIFKSWISYSAAACISMIIGSVVYLNIKSDNITSDLSNIPDQEIINYLQIHSTVNDNQYIIENLSDEGLQQVSNEISSQELEQYIKINSL